MPFKEAGVLRHTYRSDLGFDDLSGIVMDLLDDPLNKKIAANFLFEPSLSALRECFVKELSVSLQQYAIEEMLGIDPFMTTRSYAKCMALQYLGIESGLFSTQDIDNWMKTGEPLETHPETKYATWEEILTLTNSWHAKGEVIGLVHGAIDPPHAGHLSACARLYPETHKIIFGFDPNTIVKKEKG
ncbi:MAG TPA: hypothetical protein VG895_00935 [Patescibacteria group bacterium]|nr:hypothetical protein [Patescibacteria group bacterium]